jgi:ribosomal protein L11 methyltransferase
VRSFPALDLHFPTGNPVLVDIVTARLDDCSPTAIHETGTDAAPSWRVFFADIDTRDDAARALAPFAGDGLALAAIDVPDEDWAARSQAALAAVRVGRIIVAPPWDVPPAGSIDARDRVIVIKPSMGFGTGHHETTRLCLRLLQEIDVGGRSVLDVGTGSGVLSLAAVALGARHAHGIDIDVDAIASAEENRSLNAGSERVSFTVGGFETAPKAADIVTANLTGALIAAKAAALGRFVGPDGVLIVSGFQPHEADAVLTALANVHLSTVVRRDAEGEWEAAVLRMRAAPAAGGAHSARQI